MRVFYYDHLPLRLPPGHRFPAAKYTLARERIAAAGVLPPGELLPAPEATDAQIARAHDADYIHRFENGLLSEAEVRRIGLPWTPEQVMRVRHMAGGSIAAARVALRDGVAANLGGGTHHACTDHGEGYCIYNDIIIAARAMQAEGRVRRVLVIDADVHQGNGTAQMTAADPTIFTYSIHAEKNFPFRKVPSDLDTGLPDGTADDDYLRALEWGLEASMERAGAELVIYLAGADPYRDDRLGRLALSKEGLAARDMLVMERCRRAGLPVVVTLAGGYARKIEDTAELYAQTIRIAAQHGPR